MATVGRRGAGAHCAGAAAEPATAAGSQPDFAHVHAELKRPNVTLMLLWQEYYAAPMPSGLTYRYSQFTDLYRSYVATLRRSMRQVHRAGEKLFVDYAGQSVAYGREGDRAQIFVAALGASHYTFACATAHQRLIDWTGALVRALEYIDGVPALIVPDNARALIADPDRYEPRASATIEDLARHYGTAVLPARPYRPQDKAKVEVAVQIVQRWILARLRDRVVRNPRRCRWRHRRSAAGSEHPTVQASAGTRASARTCSSTARHSKPCRSAATSSPATTRRA